MKLDEFLIKGEKLRQQDRTLAIAYFEQCLRNTTLSKNEDLDTTARVLLDLAMELIGTKQPESLERAQALIQKAGKVLSQNLEINNEQKAYLLYANAILALELGDLRDVLNTLQAAYAAYGNNLEGQALTDDAIAQYYLRVGDPQSALMSFERSPYPRS